MFCLFSINCFFLYFFITTCLLCISLIFQSSVTSASPLEYGLYKKDKSSFYSTPPYATCAGKSYNSGEKNNDDVNNNDDNMTIIVIIL